MVELFVNIGLLNSLDHHKCILNKISGLFIPSSSFCFNQIVPFQHFAVANIDNSLSKSSKKAY